MVVALGIDGITTLRLKKCMLIILYWFLKICNASIVHPYFLREWQKAKVVALRKLGKPSYESL